MAQEFTVSQMKEMAKLYAQRMLDASNNGNLDLNDENLFLRIEKAELDKYANDSSFDGFLAVLALDNENSLKPTQSVILVPCDKNDNPIKTNGVMLGTERWPADPPKLQQVVYPDGVSQGVNILDGIDDAFKDKGIID